MNFLKPKFWDNDKNFVFPILLIPIAASRKNDTVITDFIKNLNGKPPGSGLDSNIL